MEKDNVEFVEEKADTETHSSEFDTVVISGGGVSGMVCLGSLQYAYDNFLLNSLENFIGTSAGSMIAFFIIIGYSPVEIIGYICVEQILEKFEDFNLVSMTNGKGAMSFSMIYEQLEKMTIKKIGYIPTFKDLFQKFGKKLVCVTFNLTENKPEYISVDTYPDMPVLLAIKMSSNLPLIFENFKYGNSYYIDGGISDNFAIDIGDKMGKKVLGLYLCSESRKNSIEPNANMMEFVYKLLFIPILQSEKMKIESVSSKCKIVYLKHEGNKFYNFKMKTSEKLDLFSHGYDIMRNDL